MRDVSYSGDDIRCTIYVFHCFPGVSRGEKKKPARLLEILKEHKEKKTLIFVNTKKGAQRMSTGFSAAYEEALGLL